jgi:hypothetical protein
MTFVAACTSVAPVHRAMPITLPIADADGVPFRARVLSPPWHGEQLLPISQRAPSFARMRERNVASCPFLVGCNEIERSVVGTRGKKSVTRPRATVEASAQPMSRTKEKHS